MSRSNNFYEQNSPELENLTVHMVDQDHDDASSIAAIPSYEEDYLDDDTPAEEYKAERRCSSHHKSRCNIVTRESVSNSNMDISSQNRQEPIVFDLNQAWQRSLQRELDKIDITVVREKHHIPAELLYIGRAESGDFVQPVDRDDISIGTNASSTVPSKAQFVHRAKSLPRNIPLFDDSSEQTGFLASTRKFINQRVQRPETHAAEQREQSSPIFGIVASSGRRTPAPQLSAAKDRELERAKAFSEVSETSYDSPLFETKTSSEDGMEPSLYPEASCFCLGYNPAELLFPSQQPYRRGSIGSMRSQRYCGPRLEGILEDTMDITRNALLEWQEPKNAGSSTTREGWMDWHRSGKTVNPGKNHHQSVAF